MSSLREQLRAIVKEELNDHMIAEGIASWLIDKVADGFKWYANKRADYQYAALLQSKEFRAMAPRFNMSEKDFMRKAAELIKRDPKKFAAILAFDVRTSPMKGLMDL